MINYIEKGIGLHDHIAALGLPPLEFIDGVWWHPTPDVVQPIIDGYTLDQAKAARCNAVYARAKAEFDAAVSDNSRGELAAWALLVSEATAYQANGGASIPNITLEAQMRGCTVADLVQRVLNNANQYQALRAQIAGNSGKHRDAIAALPNFASVAAYDISTGWPE